MTSVANPSLATADYKVVVAIDIGTTYSGYAWSTKSHKDDVTMNKPWGGEYTTQTYKTPTALLTDTNKTRVAFGYQAKMKYLSTENVYHLYDENFKMQLYNTKAKSNEDIEVTSRDGKQFMPLILLMSLSIEYLYTHFIDTVKKSHNGVLESKVRVVLTVPAIWQESSKHFMKRAAFMAGIAPERLVLALEPEAASLHCRTLTPKELVSTTDGVEVNMPNGLRYIVLDCGGGTVDISVHEIVDSGSVKEIYSANGGPWGGGRVNEEFEVMLQDLLGKQFIDTFKLSDPLDWFETNQHFEYIKRTYNQQAEINMSLPYGLIKSFEKQSENNDIAVHINKKQGFSYKPGRILFTAEVIEKLFRFSSQKIIDHVNRLWTNNEMNSVNYAFMVGGFSECEFLFQEVKNAIAKLNPGVIVLRPISAGNAVLQGAVHFGHNPNAIKSRISRKTYGAGVMKSFKSGIDNPAKRIEVDGEAKCTDIFQVWARKNESIGVGEKRVFTILPHSKSSTHFNVSIFDTDSEDVVYTTDRGVRKLADLEIPIPDNYLPKNERPVKHFVYFGGTELHIRIQDDSRPDGASHELKICFDYTTDTSSSGVTSRSYLV